MKRQSHIFRKNFGHPGCVGLLAFVLVNSVSGGFPGVKTPKVPDPVKTLTRTVEAATEGDAKLARKIAARTTRHALKKYDLGELVSEADLSRTEDAMYEFLKWKLGNPSAIAGQFATAGYEHFERAYSDEAAASLLGFELPKEKAGHSEFFFPPQLVDLRLAAQKTAIPYAAEALQQMYGIPAFVSELMLNAYVEQEAKVLKRVGFNLPKNYDFPNGLVRLTIEARRDPKGTQAKLQKVIAERMNVANPPRTPPIQRGPVMRLPLPSSETK